MTKTKEPAWRAFDLAKAKLSGAMAETLRADGLDTLGKIADFLANGGDLTGFKGIGKAKAEAVATRIKTLEEIDAKREQGEAAQPTPEPAPAEKPKPAAKKTTQPGKTRAKEEAKDLSTADILEVIPGRVLNWPWAPYPVRLETGGRLRADDPFIFPGAEVAGKLEAEGVRVEATFDQRHKLRKSEDQDSPIDELTANDRVAIRRFAVVGYQGINVAAGAATARTTARAPRPRATPTPEPTAATAGDMDVPEIDPDEAAALDEAVEAVSPE